MGDPFTLDAEKLLKVELTLDYNSPKTGAGLQQIALGGRGKRDGEVRVRLRRTANMEAPVEEREGSVPASSFERLLALFSEESFLGLSTYYEGEEGGAARTLRLVLPDH